MNEKDLLQQIEFEEIEFVKAEQLVKFPTSQEIAGVLALPGSYPAEVGFLKDITIPRLEFIGIEALRGGLVQVSQRAQELKERVQSFLDNLPSILYDE